MHIRIATSLDRDDIHSIHWSAFAEGEREIVSRLAVNLLSEETTPQTISLVAETEGIVVGHVAFSPVTIDNNENFQGYILAPLGVKPDYQKRRRNGFWLCGNSRHRARRAHANNNYTGQEFG